MDWQEIAALIVVAIAFVMLGIKFFNRKKIGGYGDCCQGGLKNKTILFTVKKGEKPKIIFK
jgi:hypothetical protein